MTSSRSPAGDHDGAGTELSAGTELLAPTLDIDLTNCDREPIHLSGAVQSHGVLLAVRGPEFAIAAVSANSTQLLGATPATLLARPLGDVLGQHSVAILHAALLDPRRAHSVSQLIDTPVGPFGLTWFRTAELLVVELEPAQALAASGIVALFEATTQAMQGVHDADGVAALCSAAACEVRALSGYDRVMVYRFHPDWHGEVVAEQRADGLEPYLGLHYPASDIPRQARALFLLNQLRVIADVDAVPSPLRAAPDTDVLDLSRSALRSVSPIHLEYLRNMGVRATLTLSLIHNGRLWGLIACHHYTPRIIGAQVQSSCRLLSQAVGMRVVAQETQDQTEHRARLAAGEALVLTRMATAESLADALAEHDTAAGLTGAQAFVTCIDGRTATFGTVPSSDAVAALLAVLRRQTIASELVCDEVGSLVTEMRPFTSHAAGLLAVSLSGNYEDFILWFRDEWVHTVNWAGNPDKPTAPAGAPAPDAAARKPLAPGGARGGVADPGLIRLTPRSSFRLWAQHVVGRSRPWLAAEIDTARSLARAIPDLQLARARTHVEQLTELAHREAQARSAVAAALADEQRQLQDLARTAAVGMFVHSVNPPQLRYVNPALRSLLRIDPGAGDPTVEDLLARVHPEDHLLARNVFAYADVGGPVHADVRIVSDTEPLWWVRVTSTPSGFEHRLNRSGTVEDITAHKAAEAALQAARTEVSQANAAKDEFLSRMSHELRTPLNAVLGFGQLLELGELSDPQREAVDQILGGGRLLLAMVNDVLDLTGTDASTVAISSEPVCVADVISEAVLLLRSAALAAHIDIGFEPDLIAAGLYVLADRARLRQVLLNLLDNAIKYNKPDGRVDITLRTDKIASTAGDEVTIALTDTGLGIRAADLPRLFQAFDRLGRQALGVEGTGIGLALAQRLVVSMGGRLDVTSHFGQSSTFTVTFARAATSAAPTSPPASRTLLYIEDNLSNVALLSSILQRRSGWVLVHAPNSAAALEQVGVRTPDVIVVQLHLSAPGESNVIRALKSDPVTAGIPIAVLSPDGGDSLAGRLQDGLIQLHIPTPLDVGTVLGFLDNLPADSQR